MFTDHSSSLFQTLQASIFQSMVCHTQNLSEALAQLEMSSSILTEIALHMMKTLQTGHKLLIAGNGGSAAEAQHFAAEFVGRFQRERAAYAAIALTADTALLTALANDYGYPQVFARQIHAVGQAGDLLIMFSTSGESENLVQAAIAGRERSIEGIAIISNRTCRLELVADLALRVPVIDTALTQELHMLITHLLCEIVEKHLSENPSIFR
jgi:D-sedoheptulose 7-phosphate isomerase